MTSSRIDTEDPGAVPGASTIDTRTADRWQVRSLEPRAGIPVVGQTTTSCIFDGGEIGSTGVIKTRSRQKANVLDANDNAPIAYRLAA